MLHTVNKSPFARTRLETCLRFVQPGDPILLVEDGVYAAHSNNGYATRLKEVGKSNPLYALNSDLTARGIIDVLDAVTVIDYDGFVDLVEDHQVLSW